MRGYLPKANGYVIGYLAAHDTNQHHCWNRIDGRRYGDQDDTLRPRIILVLMTDIYRRYGGRRLARAGTRRRLRVPGRRYVAAKARGAARHLARRCSHGSIWGS
ncbi:hypothetical protein [Streptomyces platensis]|uniref:hypothetical protein n=1 Tax=Streptomyces platensis TaxID=58346 RepID=UPI001F190C9F|nr:hypothetical protein [Streptomyces platensis]MCF3148470.1 hypothetical protein [Streptomyces platensis]